MKSYTEREYLAGLASLHVLATEVVAAIPHHRDTQGREIRCHELTRAVWRRLYSDAMGMIAAVACPSKVDPTMFRVVDGKFSMVDHSWIELRAHGPACRNQYNAILDVYAVGAMPQVQMIDRAPILAERVKLYKAGERRSDIREDVIDTLLWSMGMSRSDDDYVCDLVHVERRSS